jgi:hypothetical protein
MFCTGCGQANVETAQFCARCGQTLVPPPSAPSEAPFAPGAPLPSYMTSLPPPMPPPGRMPLPTTMSPQASMPMGYGVLCAVCGNPLPPGNYLCRRCGAPAGTVANPYDPTAATFVPIPSSAYPQTLNMSGLHTTPGTESSHLPGEVKGCCWGPLNPLVTPFWCLAHNMTGWGVGLLLSLVVVVGWPLNLVMALFFFLQGRELAWKNRRFTDPAQFQHTQRTWGWWSLAVLAFIIVPMIVLMGIAGSSD